MKINYMSWILWLVGFVCGVVGSITDMILLYYLGFAIAVVGLLIIKIKNKNKQVWQLIIDLLVMTP